jgi:hypothetical protein
MQSYRTGTLLAVLVLGASDVAIAQVPVGKRELVGIVRDPRGGPVEGAVVEIPGSGTRSDSKGTFRLFTREIDTVTLAIRRPGYSPIEALISANGRQWDTVVVELEPNVTNLASVRIEEEKVRRTGLKGFLERQVNGHGMYIGREEIVKRNASRTTDVLQARKGIRLVNLGGGRSGVRFATYSGARTNCTPDMWVDGQLARGMELDDLTPNTVEAIELYDTFTTVPAEFTMTTNTLPCGTIVVWTRPPGTKKP